MTYQPPEHIQDLMNRYINQDKRFHIRDLTNTEHEMKNRINNNARTLELKMYADIMRFKQTEGLTL